MYKTKEEVKSWLKEMKIKKYIINNDLTVDVKEEVNISGQSLSEIPVQFNVVDGNFACNLNSLTSLKGCPKVVNGDFSCRSNKLTNLENCPEVIKGDFNCNSNNIKSLKNLKENLKNLEGDFYCGYNGLTSLEGCLEVINGNFSCINNKLSNLEGCPKVINGAFHCFNNNLTNLENCPEKVLGDFDCSHNKLTSLEHIPNLITNGYLSVKDNKIDEESLVNICFTNNSFTYIYNDILKNDYGSVESFFNKVNYYKSKKENELLKDLSINSNNMKLNKKL